MNHMLPAVAMVVAKLTLPHSLPNLLDDYNISIHILIFYGKKILKGVTFVAPKNLALELFFLSQI